MEDPRDHDPILWFEWDSRWLDGVTLTVLMIAPFWSASLIMRHEGLAMVLLWAVACLLAALSWVKKPCFAFDTRNQTFYSPDGDEIALTDLDRIEVLNRDIYFIGKAYGEKGFHLRGRPLFFSPTQSLLIAAEHSHWPLKRVK